MNEPNPNPNPHYIELEKLYSLYRAAHKKDYYVEMEDLIKEIRILEKSKNLQRRRAHRLDELFKN